MAARDGALGPDRGGSEFSPSLEVELTAEERKAGLSGAGPYRLAARRLRRNRTALAAGGVFVLLVFACLAAPVWSNIAGRSYDEQPGGSETVEKGGEEVLIVSFEGIPIGPTWNKEFFLGADSSGRDVLVRLLYGGRNSLLIGMAAAIITTLLGMIIGLLAGYSRGWVDSALSRLLDVIWAFPVILLGIALGTALAEDGLKVGPVEIAGNSLLIPIFIIAIVYVPYLARPIRGEVLALREKEYVEAARAQGQGPLRIMFTEILPNVVTTLIVFFPLLVANAVLLEAALSFLGAGVQPPSPSWGSMIDDGVERIVSAAHLAIVPGAMLVLTVLSLNIFGDGVRDALDPRAKLKIDH
ncbi:MAG: ABC transporter permease [Solirubrobacterales bacterium]